MKARVVLIASPCGRWWMRAEDGALAELPLDEAGFPVLPEGAEVVRSWLPIEWSLVVPLVLPRMRPQALDAEVIAEEAEEKLGMAPEGWRWCWHARIADEQLVGLAFGIQEGLWQRLVAHGLAALGIDALAVLAVVRANDEPQGVIAEDPEGIWVGFWDGKLWRGALRLGCFPQARRWEEARRALAGMGWQEGMPVFGCVGEDAPSWIQRRGDAFASRCKAVAAGATSLPVPGWQVDTARHARKWRAALAFAALAFATFVAERMWEVHLLRARAALYEAQIQESVRKALPGVPIVDPLLQLRRAAGKESPSTAKLFAMLAAAARARKDAQIEMFSFQAGEGAVLAGTVPNLEALAALRARLGRAWPQGVQLLDSEARAGKVRFRIRLEAGR